LDDESGDKCFSSGNQTLPDTRSHSITDRMNCHPIKTHHPLMRRRAGWHVLSRAEMRLLMAGLMDWEFRSIGPMRARLRRKRLDAVEFFRRFHGPLPNDRLWMTAGRESHRHRRRQSHEARSERAKGVMWHHF
jgi:hypothetical protein